MNVCSILRRFAAVLLATAAPSIVARAELLVSSSVPAETIPPAITAVTPVPGSAVTNITRVTVTFSEPVTGVTADALLVNGASATNVAAAGNTYTFKFPPPNYGPVYFTWAAAHTITDLALPPNRFDETAPSASWNYTRVDVDPPVMADLFPSPGLTVRMLSAVEVTFSEPVTGVDAADLRINGQPATNVTAQPINRYVFEFPPPPPGAVNFVWTSGHGVTDLALPPNALAGGAWTVFLDPNASTVNLVITEIAAANQHGLEDEDIDPLTGHGEPEDWIEIQNRGAASVDLAGWSLSDDPELPGQWVFPSRILVPGRFLVVFASGKDRRPSGTNNLHTNFQLSSGGEFLGLYSPDSPRLLASSYAPKFPEQRNDVSFGLDLLGQWRYFATPTPGASNGTSTITGVASPVHFSVGRGHFTEAFTLHLSTDTPGGVIRYTTNGSTPTLLNGLPYVLPLRIMNTTVIRAAAFKTNFLPSTVATHTYLFNQPAAVRSLPIISIVTDQNNLTGPLGIIGISNVVQLGDGTWAPADATGYHNPSKHGLAWERPTSVELIRFDNEPGFQADCGIRVQGSDYQRPRTTASSKFSFRLYFRGDYGPGRLEYPLFPGDVVNNFNQIVLRAGFNDPTNPFLRDELTRRLSADQSQAASHGTFANLFINGVYKGYYNPCERVHETFAQNYHGGSPDWDVVGPPFATGAGAPGVIDGDRTAFASLMNYVNSQDPATTAVFQEIARRLELTNFIDYLLLNVYEGMGDWPGNNFRAGKDRGPGGIFRFWVWDGEWGFGIYGRAVTRDTFAESGPGPDNSGLSSTGNSEIAQLYQRLRLNPEFRLLWADRIHKHMFNNGALTDANIIDGYVAARAELSGVIPSFDNSILTTWIPQRRAVVMNLFNTYGLIASSNAPGFNQLGGAVPRGFNLVMTNLTGTIYYTTNGADPRVPFTGTVAVGALTYTGPLTLDQTTLIKARSLSGGKWSALTEARFDVALLGVALRVTEINYHAPDNNPAYEFLELRNVGSAPLDLSGMSFEGITFTFRSGTLLAPGAVFLLVSGADTNAFLARYPGTTIHGTFTGNLDNGGERLALRDTRGQIVFTVDYDDGNGWPTAADGGGSSLEVIDPLGDPDDPANWRASATLYGTPGVVTAPPAPGAVVLNEIMAFNVSSVANGTTYPDWIELHNTTAAPVNLAGWSVSDDANPRKFVFPAGTTVPANGYLVVWCDDATNTTPGLHAGFALDADRESVFLFNASTTRVDAVSFGAQLPDLSLGRIAGAWVLNTPTPAAANSAAAVAPADQLTLNEWLADALPGEPDWIELYNRSGLPAALQGFWLSSTNGTHRIVRPAFVAPGGFVQLFADEGVGWNHLDFKLPAVGGAIALTDPLGREINRVTYGAQAEGVSQGHLPDGTGAITSFPGSASPGASNYVIAWTGPYLNEVLARNTRAVTNSAGRTADFIELFHPGATSFDLSTLSLRIGADSDPWRFPAGTALAPNGYLVVWCDGTLSATTNAGAFLNTGRSLDGDGDDIALLDAAGRIVSSVEFGPQIEDRSLGRVAGTWRLLSSITPGATNGAPATLGAAAALRLNEWMADGAGDDWFELFNSTNLPVDLGGLLLSDDFSQGGQVPHRIPALSFIAPRGWVKFVADGQPDAGRTHVNFSLDADGDSLRLASNTVTLDAVSFGRQLRDVSEGRWPDGQTNLVAFPGSASPGASNYRLIDNVAISEVLAHNPAPLEAAIELRNLTDAPLGIGGWYLSDSATNFLKFRIPDGTVLPANGYAAFYENAFNSGAPGSFSLSIERGGEVWLTTSSAPGADSGYRTVLAFGPSIDGVSHGRVRTTQGEDIAPLAAPTFGVDNPVSVTEFRQGAGQTNVGPLVGPVVINEIMYHSAPLTNSSRDDEYIELHNFTEFAVPLYRLSSPTNRWRLTGAVEFEFAIDTSIPALGYLLVVNFDPVNDPITLAAFRARYGLASSVSIVGPYRGKLDNAGEDLRLLRFGPPQGTPPFDPARVPEMLADRVNYRNAAPWPAGLTDGGGASMQRRQPPLYGNEPTNWVAAWPTPGAANGSAIVAPPTITQSSADQSVLSDSTVTLTVIAAGSAPFAYQWRFNGRDLLDATNAALPLAWLQPEQSGFYDAVVSNPGGSAVSRPISLEVLAVPEILLAPASQSVRLGSNATFTVLARGTEPLSYQWRFGGTPLPGATADSLTLTNLQISADGDYEVVVSNRAGQSSARAALTILQAVAYLVRPASNIVVVAGGDFRLSAVVTGNPAPYGFSWRRITPSQIWTNVLSPSRTHFITFNTTALGLVLTNNQATLAANCRLVISNAASTGPGVESRFTITMLADSDHDGLPDVWEAAYEATPGAGLDPAVDADGDGLSNGEEFVAGTDPTDPESVLAANLTPAFDGPMVLFDAMSNLTYTVEFTDGLGASWRKLMDVPAQQTNRVEILSDPLWSTNRFYRVVTPQQP